MGQVARAGSLEKDRPGQDYDATLLPNRQHAEPLNMQPLFFFNSRRLLFLFSLPCLALDRPPASAASLGWDLTSRRGAR